MKNSAYFLLLFPIFLLCNDECFAQQPPIYSIPRSSVLIHLEKHVASLRHLAIMVMTMGTITGLYNLYKIAQTIYKIKHADEYDLEDSSETYPEALLSHGITITLSISTLITSLSAIISILMMKEQLELIKPFAIIEYNDLIKYPSNTFNQYIKT